MKKILCLVLSVAVMFCVLQLTSITSASNVLFGDANGDGEVDPKDVLILRKLSAKLVSNADINRFNADVNYDGKVNAVDIRNIREYLAHTRDTITPSEYTTIAADAVTYNISQIESSMSVVGRGVYEDGLVKLSQTASGFKFTADCHGNVMIGYSSNNNCKLSISADENYDSAALVDLKKGDNLICYASLNLEEGQHTIEVRKATEATLCSLVTIDSIMISGTPGTAKPAVKPYRIEFYGDSITSGYGNLSEQVANRGSWEWQDGSRTYASYTAHKLNAEYAVASASGHGILGGHSDTTSLYTKFFDYSLLDTKTPWSRADYDADLIVINYGANDNSRIEKEIQKGTFDEAQFAIDFEAECSKIVDTIRTDNPDVEILWVTGMNYIAETSHVVKCLKNIDEKYDCVNFYHSVARQNGGDWHPNVEDHKIHADNLCNKIDELYPQLFKEN